MFSSRASSLVAAVIAAPFDPLGGDRGAQRLGVLVEPHESERVEPVEQPSRVAAGAQVESEPRVVGVREAVQARQRVDPRDERGRDVEHPAAPHGRELRPVPDERERRAGLVRDGQQGERGVLIEHPRLVHHNPLGGGQPALPRRAAVGRARHRVRVAHGQPGPDPIGVPPEPVVVDERGNRVGRHAQLDGSDVGGLLRRRHHPHRTALALGGADRGTEHGRLARTRRALHHDERRGAGDRGGGARLVHVQPRLLHARGCAVRLPGGACGQPVAQLRLDGHDVQRREVRHMLQARRTRRQDREAVVRGQPGRDGDELAQLLAGGAHTGLGDDARHPLLHVMHRPCRCSSRAAVERTGGDPLHGQLVQRAQGLHGGARQVRRVAGLLQLAQPAGLGAEHAGLLARPLVIPRLRVQPGAHHRPRLLAGMRRLPLGLEPGEVARHLLPALGHDRVPRHQLRDLPGHRVKGEAVRVEHRGELRVRGDDRRTEGADRALLPEQRRGIEPAPATGRPHARPDLEVDVPVGVARTGGLVRHGDGFELFDRHDLLLPTRADPRDRVLAEPGPDLRNRVPLGGVQGLGYRWVQAGGDRQGLRDVHDHLHEPGRSPAALAPQPGSAHRLPGERVDPVNPLAVLLGGQPELADHSALGACTRSRCARSPSAGPPNRRNDSWASVST